MINITVLRFYVTITFIKLFKLLKKVNYFCIFITYFSHYNFMIFNYYILFLNIKLLKYVN
jgi:hypothetical protein